ncbi:bifunctional indole-3-glycerol-phosphate synthase TrpC/phosphoribosylanthranilate isomerase TrpF [Thalassotalea sp. HSM 43]|uniref:bifunctional indole-3-glycerol-phosphate synthase TrpC/phosphoribosylanthranilate isomerase TrpF n=1 Tax=Thalassotalea sp. HSM 43 TaxID=2552945 RepID=UPI00107FF06F|nr:bifunctional indole-3-glycerol-phosphate synthase TrpC/phosphoribosylanthranilate isomerase TrpF [Thalassotalea sp. HSM 43]QBY05332.1 bifunctional indole-3-glycerol-phosphate synthase TrpC/phosphoribosylanthranilate isomerase TrpF [Thalassotalea sp. HSM 43]
MANILEKIVADKRTEVDALKQQMPLAEFIDDLMPTDRDMYAALSQDNAGFILECKKASPSKGLIRDIFDPVEIASVYQQYAAAISVLTDYKYFQGKHDYLQQVRQTVQCPVLNKDFFIDEYQIHLGRYYGADAILLMLSVLDDQQYKALAKVAEHYNMAILTEVSNVEETQRAIDLNAKLIGINNRNLRDLSTDLSTTFELATMIPDDRLIISESGIYNNKQVRELAPLANGFLVGSSIMAEEDIDLACRRLIYGNNKVCGLSRADDVIAAAKNGAVMAGMIFVEQSPRYISVEQAIDVQQQVAERFEHGIDYVAVFKDQHIDDVTAICKQLHINAVQLHGNEDSEYINTLKQRLDDKIRIIKALPVDAEIAPFTQGADLYLLDNKQGGSGQAFDWSIVQTSNNDFSQCLLAGGLNCDNLNCAIRLLNDQDMQGVDLNSGLELAPGVKDADKIQQAFALLRQY